MSIYSKETGKVLTTHSISSSKGKSILKAEHRIKDRTTIANLEQSLLKYLLNSEIAKLYLEGLSQDKERYYLDNMKHVFKYMKSISPDDILKAMTSHMNNNTYNAGYLISELLARLTATDVTHSHSESTEMTQYQPEKRSINEYKEILS